MQRVQMSQAGRVENNAEYTYTHGRMAREMATRANRQAQMGNAAIMGMVECVENQEVVLADRL